MGGLSRVDLNLEQQRVFGVNRIAALKRNPASFEHKLAERVQDSAMQEKSQLVRTYLL